MRKIEVKKWKAINREGKEIEENLLSALNVLIINKRPEDMPKGLDKFRIFNKLAKAFDDAEKSGELVLEEKEYAFLKNTVEKEIPSQWGLNPQISEAIEVFLDAKEE